MPGRIRIAALAAGLAWALVPGARTAFAVGSTDYVATPTSGLYESPPAGAVAVAGSQSNARADLPFEFPYFGVIYDHVNVTIGGYVTFGNDPTSASVTAQDPSTIAAGSSQDGECGPLYVGVASGSLASTFKWTAGTAPNRRFIISYENVAPYSGGTARMTFQVRLFEGSGRIEFAYKPDSTPSTWTGLAYSIGMVAPGSDARWFAPVNSSATNSGHPANDYRMDPRTVTISGRILYDRLTPTALGWGVTTTPAPASFAALDLLYSDGRTAAHGATDATGAFQFTALPAAAGTLTDLYASAKSPAAIVHPVASGSPYARRVAQNVASASDANLNTLIVDAASDPTASFRGPMNVAAAIGRIYGAVSTLSTATIAQLSVTWDASSAAATAYSPVAGANPATMTVAGPSASNPDTWDDGVIDRVYGRHVLSSIAPRQILPIDDRIDAVTEPTNAFSVGFGCSLYAAVEGKSQIIDATSATTATVFDLETPSLASPKGPDAAGWVAAALYDQVDPANEPFDWTDGTVGTAATDGYVVVSTMTVVPDAKQFFIAWAKSGRDSLALSRNFVAQGLLSDDAAEPNDVAGESAAFGAVGTRKDGFVLNSGNEDWFTFDVPTAMDDVRVDMSFLRSTVVTTIELQVIDDVGAQRADKVDSGQGPVQLAVGALAAGTYRARVRSVSGDIVPAYTLQVSNRLRMDHTPLKSWTAGIPYRQDIALSGGILPYTLAAQSGTVPPGLLFDAVLGRATGTPATPGTYDFTLGLQDAGNPTHIELWPHHMVIAPPLAIDFGKFVAFPAGRAVDVVRPHVGGTLPLSVSVTGGALPDGVQIAPGDLRFTGTATLPGAYAVTIGAVDGPGSAASASTTAVVCVALAAKKTPVDLPAHAPACGFFFDAVAGSTASISVANAPKVKVRRALALVVLGPDGLPVTGGKFKAGAGKASAASVPAATSGRYYAVVDAGDGDDEPLLGTPTVKPPTKFAGTIASLQPGSSTEISFGALAGAKLSFTAKPDRTSGESLAVIGLQDPTGAFVPVDDIAKTKGTTALLSTQLATSGTWKIRVAANGGSAGSVAYAIKLVEHKGATFSAD